MNSKKFSERKGYTKVEEIIQKESLNDSSRKSLWNLLYSNVWGKINDPQASKDVFYAMRIHFFQANGQLNFLLEQIWIKILERTIDRVPISWDNYLDEIKKYFFNIKWYEVYDFIEFILESTSGELNYHLTIDLNELFSKERIPYAIINNLITDITNDSELNGINEALGTPFGTVNTHVSTSLSLLYSNSPDYRNSIKESISAVEAIVKIITKSPNGTLGDLLKILERNYPMHPAFKDSLSKLYGYTSNGDGIRHALMEESNLTKEDAKLMLILCSGFVNFILERVSKQNSD